ncbi:MAG: hypothetical protein OEZ10_03835 [Gammaproteobacteria bacterium]|nr:hypothetical protein [Gammaproteobacteria bacterium]
MKILIASSIIVYSTVVLAEEPEFTYLEPKNVPGLTSDIAAKLEEKNCLVPKWRFEFGGVTKGEFAISGQTDIAVICTKNGMSEIIIFWGGPAKCPSNIKSTGQFISTVGKKYILDHYGYYGGNKPPKITHQAINDHYVEKSSVVKYCNNGNWVNLVGAD